MFSQLGEDADLGLRAEEMGLKLTYSDSALVWHAVLPRTPATAVREALRRDTVPALIARHRRARDRIFLRVFWKQSHAGIVLGLGGVAFARRRPFVGLLLLVPYLSLGFDRRAHRSPRGFVRFARHQPARLLVDLAELLATLRGAVRARSFVV